MKKTLSGFSLVIAIFALLLSVYTLIVTEKNMKHSLQAAAIDVSRVAIETNEQMEILKQSLSNYGTSDPIIKQIQLVIHVVLVGFVIVICKCLIQ